MDELSIEQIDKARFKAKVGYTIGYGFMYGFYFLLIFNEDRGPQLDYAFLLAEFVFFIVLIFYCLRTYRLNKKIQSSPALKDALNNEYYHWLENKSYVVASYGFAGGTGIVMVASMFFPISALMACIFILYVGTMAALIASLVFHKS